MRRIEKITGRTDDMIILRGVNLFPTPDRGARRCASQALSPHFQLELTRPQRLDVLTVRIESRSDASVEAGERACALLAQRVKDRIGVTVEVVRAELIKAYRQADGRGKGGKQARRNLLHAGQKKFKKDVQLGEDLEVPGDAPRFRPHRRADRQAGDDAAHSPGGKGHDLR